MSFHMDHNFLVEQHIKFLKRCEVLKFKKISVLKIGQGIPQDLTAIFIFFL